jgi:exodeoxyribonuclease III
MSEYHVKLKDDVGSLPHRRIGLSMKISTWNVNGFRAVIKKNFLADIKELDPDILCIQEIKAREDQLTPETTQIPGYLHVWNSAKRPGYSGVATYIKKDLIHTITKGMGIELFDVEGRVIQISIENVVLYNVYFPNGQRGQDRVDYKLQFYDQLIKDCLEKTKEGKSVIVTGDFNTAHNEIDLANPKENEKTSGFLPEERVKVTKFIESGYVDAYRLLYPEKVQYTWWTYRFAARQRGIGWRLDYYLVSKDLIDKVKSVTVHDEIMGSDHCPVTMDISI